MKLNAKFFALFLGVLCFASFAHAVDTLEVFVLRVQFKKESPDNSLTTGTGPFDTDTATYNLDPSGSRGNKHYWRKHLDFANSYYQAASGGTLVIRSTIFPEDGTAYELDKTMIDYNRTQKMKGEKTAEFDEARSRDYLRFVYDAVMKAHNSGKSPFKVPLSKNPNTKRAFMIAHAGASSLLDGGSMGMKGANTPGDMFDAYISRAFWSFLPDTLPEVVIAKDSVDNGLVLKGASIDTLRTVMVVSETASQDGLNWGINGIVVNQIGREIGMPNTYDAVKGISRLGYFDMMDFAGYNAGNGFFPVLPAAWERAYMGWSQVKEVRPTAGHPVSVDIAAAGSGLGTEIVKVALSASEYILIENRQRSWDKDGNVEVYLGKAEQNNDTTDLRSILVDSLNTVFEDSVCTKGKCVPNKKKAKGLVLGVSNFDAALPASGIAVWKVNDWFLRESLPAGAANLWLGEDLRDHQYGLSLVESDGVLSIGKTFKNAIGEDAYDFGSGSDLLPHVRYSKTKKPTDTVMTISPDGYANTATTQGGYTGIKISVEVPKKARVEKTANAFMGDSVLNFAAPIIRVTISIDDGSIEKSKFPKNVGLANAVRGAVFVNYEDDKTGKAIVFASEDGTLQAMNALGDTLFTADTVGTPKTLSRNSAKREIPLYRVGAGYGALVGIAGDGERVYSLHKDKLVRTSFNAGVPISDVMDLKKSVSGAPAIKSVEAGPVVANSHLFFASDSGFWTVNLADDMSRSFTSTEGLHPQDLALCKVDKKDFYGVVVGEEGKIFMRKFTLENKPEVKPSFSNHKAGTAQVKAAKGEVFRVACTDLDRDGTVEAVVLGSRGTVASVKLSEGGEQPVAWTYVYRRGSAGKSGLRDELSGIALGDINDDGYPEIVFLGDNLVYALDRFGIPVDGFPVTINRGTPVAAFHSDPLLVDVTGDKIPEILVPSSDGLVYAYTGKGKRISERFPIAAGSFEMTDSLQQNIPMSIFVADGVKESKGPEIYAFHRNNVTAYRLDKASDGAEKAAAAWALPAGGNERTGFFDASRLPDVDAVKAKDEIKDFFIYPNPVRGGDAKVRMELGAKPQSIKLELYDITGLCVFKTNIPDGIAGKNQANLDLRSLGSDIYTARLKVKFESGKTKQKLYRVGVVR